MFLKVKQYLYRLIAWGLGGLVARFAWVFLAKDAVLIHEKIKASISLDEISHELVSVILAAEDHRFFFHRGVDPIAIARAFLRTTCGHLEGASTIEQQLVRVLQNDYRICFKRKVLEALLASTLYDRFSKIEILRAYLSVAYFGSSIRGYQDAHLLLPIGMLNSTYELAFLIAHLKFPKPDANNDKWARRRSNRVLRITSRIKKLVDWVPRELNFEKL